MTDRPAGTLALVTSLVALGPLSMSLYVPSMPAIQAEFGVDAAAVQSTLTLFLLGFAVAQLFIGPLSDKLGRRPVLIGGLVAYIASSVLCALAPDVFWLTVARFAQGFAGCAGPVVGRAIVRDLFDREAAARAFSVVGTAVALAPALGPMVGGVIQTGLGWEAAFVTLAGIGVLLGLLAYRRFGETIPQKLPDALSPFRLVQIYVGLLRNRFYLGHALAVSLVFGGYFAYVSDVPFLFIEELGIGPDVFGFLMIFTVAGFALGTFLSGRLIGRVAPRLLILAGCTLALCAAIGVILSAGELSVVRLVVPMTVYMFAFGLVMPPSMSGALGPFPRVAGSASAMLGFIQMGSAGFASVLVQPLFDGTARPLGFVVAGMSGAGLLAYLLLARGQMPAETTGPTAAPPPPETERRR